MKSYIYFLRPIGFDGPTKIGCSRVPHERRNELTRYSPFPLELLAEYPGDADLERRLHHRFVHLHSHCEWFRTSSEIDAVIEAIRTETFDPTILPAPKRLAPLKPRDPSVYRAVGNSIRLNKLIDLGVVLPDEVKKARHTYQLPPDEVARRRAIIAAFVEAHRDAA